MGEKYTKEQIEEVVSNNLSVASSLRALNLRPAGGNYKWFKKIIKDYNLDISHFTGQGWNKGKKNNYNRSIPLEEILIENSTYVSSNSLRKRLLKEGIKTHKCEKCNNETWNDLPIPLELDHINGNNIDNRIENLRVLCPNCHAQTESYRGKNKVNYKANLILKKYNNSNNNILPEIEIKKDCKKLTKVKKIIKNVHRYDSCQCGNTKNSKASLCLECYSIQKSSLSKRPSPEQLIQDFKLLKSFVQVGKKYGVSDNAVRKWVKLYKMNIE